MLPRVDLVKAADAHWLLMEGPDLISARIRQHGAWEQPQVDVARAFLSGLDSPIVIDAGANLGGFAVPVAQTLMRQSGRIWCFEPQRIVYQQLCANLFINRVDNAYTVHAALGEHDGLLNVPELDYARSANVGGFSVDPDIRFELARIAAEGLTPANAIESSGACHPVPLRLLDAYQIYSDVAFLKCDVEGMELELFRGARETLEQNRYPPILFENWANQPWYADKAARTEGFLADLGYTFDRLESEILAQHPRHHSRLAISFNGDHFTAQLQR
jgi:FkbM family methyltransferase